MVARLLILIALLTAASPARADDVTAAGRSVARVVTVVFDENGQVADFGHGSGFAISARRVITNAHVVENAEEFPENVVIGVVPSEGSKSFPARLVAIDRARDLALLELREGTLPPTALYVGPLADGQAATALGYPGNVDIATAQSANDFITPLPPTRSSGNFSNLRKIMGITTLLHTAGIARGNSGGPLVDDCGRVLGVNTLITRADDGDSPFAFAIANTELQAFLRGAGQTATTIGTPCTSMAELLRAEAQRAENEARKRDSADFNARDAARQADADALSQAQIAAQGARENRIAIALALGTLGLVAFGVAGLLEYRAQRQNALWAGGGGLVLTLAALVTFITRPSIDDVLVKPAAPAASQAAAPASLDGPRICTVVPERSRVTVSSTEDITLDWKAGGCVNGRTQYIEEAGAWRRILVPASESAVSVASFDPAANSYSVKRYLLGGDTMASIRAARGKTPNACVGPDALAAEQTSQAAAIALLPPMPNELINYACAEAR